jgi:hypothetical protein
MAGSGPACVKGGGGGGGGRGGGAEAKGGDSDAKAEMPAESKALNDFKSDMGDTAERGKSRGGTYCILLLCSSFLFLFVMSLSISYPSITACLHSLT